MKKTGKIELFAGLLFIAIFAIFTLLVQIVDVNPLGVNGTNIGFSTFNCMIHKLCGVNMTLYTITDWAGLVPIFIIISFGIIGFTQLIKRRSLIKVDADILILGVYYIIVATIYVVFEMMSINFRPILINGFMEVSYPSSTTLLVLSVIPTLAEQTSRRYKNSKVKISMYAFTATFSVFMVIGRLISGVHWFTDILGSVIMSVGLYCTYKGFVLMFSKKV